MVTGNIPNADQKVWLSVSLIYLKDKRVDTQTHGKERENKGGKGLEIGERYSKKISRKSENTLSHKSSRSE